MTLDKAIDNGKERRKQYYGSKAIDRTCRCHGGCPYCEGNRLHKRELAEMDAVEQIDEFTQEPSDAD